MRRQQISQSVFDSGYSDSVNPLTAAANTWGAGSCNGFLVGDNVTRPFGGYNSQGTGSGTNYSCQFGSDFGGLKNYSSTTGQGSLILDYSNSLFGIGAGKASKAGANLKTANASRTFTSGDVNTTTGNINLTAHGFSTGEPIYLTTTGALPLALVVDQPYFVISVDADNFKLATTYARSIAGTAITGGTTGTGTQTLFFGDDIIITSVLQVGSILNGGYIYSYLDNAGLDQSDAPSVTVPGVPGAAYLGLINGAVNFKVAPIRDRQNQGVDIDNPNAPVKGRASSASAVVLPINATAKITFPTAQTGQTHWAVFSTQEGFGGTGDFYRLGWRQSSSEDATWYFGISETTVAADPNRTLEFDYRTGDLLPETAWDEDYPPQAGTHAVRITNVMIVFGTGDGTVAQVSLPNFYESYNPYHLLYFPEPVTAVLHRQVDDFAIAACRNSIHIVQYVGYRGGNLPSATITTITPEIGVAFQSNWAFGAGEICIFIEGTGLVMMDSTGNIDLEFGRAVNIFTRTWLAKDVVVAFDPNTRSFVAGNGTSSVAWCVETKTWTSPIYNTDAGVTGTWISGINANGRLYATLDNAGTQTAYIFDDNSVNTRMPMCAISQWQSSPLGRSVRIYEAALAIDQGNTTEPLIIGIHANLFKPYLREASVSSGSNVLTSIFTAQYTGLQAAVFGANIGGSGVNFIIVKLTYQSGTTATMTSPTTGSNVNAQANAAHCFVLVGRDFFTVTPLANVQQYALNFRPAVMDIRSWAISTFMPTDAVIGNVFGHGAFGTMQETSVINVT